MSRARTSISVLDARRIGRRIRDARVARRFSQGQLAAVIGVSQQELSEWERGKRCARLW